ncbi:hypothetical protein O9G_001767 [Rozella allomycis CSF55]|uniref:DNA replication complex GINS protein PSF1 n=1 Tax=Rozella allomycis (strain CSF55) TaxID=988480 RepID=A0A075AT57_ROZAC|nr:hypothetical protein O9G_001767 [Rozella allomycis CSF55]|eukprot:EPZ33355.1 hypothetical protein O9G_001767 [Rozella allomycis CSF55]
MAKMISKASLVPPKDLFIQIRVLKDCGNLLTTSGVITLEKDSQHFVRRTDVEHLISQGHVIHELRLILILMLILLNNFYDAYFLFQGAEKIT